MDWSIVLTEVIMKSRILFFACTLACAAGMAAAQGSAPTPAMPPSLAGPTSPSAQAQPMANLQQAAQRLRESIQALAQKKPGPDRDGAIAQAQQALLETQRAMVALPPETRTSGSALSDADYDRSVKKLMRAADKLRDSIQAIAQQSAGERRERALSQTRKALWDTQQAMMSAYSPDVSRSGSSGAQGGK